MMKNYGGVKAAQSEDYNNRIEAYKKKIGAGQASWQNQKFVWAITAIFVAGDFCTLFTMFDKCFTQAAWIGLVMSFICAVLLDSIPVFLARTIHNMIYHTKKNAKIWFFVLVCGFILVFTSTLFLRFAFKDTYVEEEQSYQLENTVSDENATSVNAGSMERKSVAIVLFLGLLPLATSVASLAIAYHCDNEIQVKYDSCRMTDMEYDEAISDLKAAIAAMNSDVERDLKLDEECLRCEIDRINTRRDALKAAARLYLAEYLGNPSATSKISHEMMVTSEDQPPTGMPEEHHGVETLPLEQFTTVA